MNEACIWQDIFLGEVGGGGGGDEFWKKFGGGGGGGGGGKGVDIILGGVVI